MKARIMSYQRLEIAPSPDFESGMWLRDESDGQLKLFIGTGGNMFMSFDRFVMGKLHSELLQLLESYSSSADCEELEDFISNLLTLPLEHSNTAKCRIIFRTLSAWEGRAAVRACAFKCSACQGERVRRLPPADKRAERFACCRCSKSMDKKTFVESVDSKCSPWFDDMKWWLAAADLAREKGGIVPASFSKNSGEIFYTR